jgi:hypothetical protein
VRGLKSQLRALFVAQESTAAAGAAASGAAAGGPLGWLTGLAALASMIAALAAVPKFARGGIVGGTSYSGDYVNARVNSGEMILNRTQQSNLLAMANGHGGGGNAVHFEIKGSDLVGVLSNYNKKVGKYS